MEITGAHVKWFIAAIAPLIAAVCSGVAVEVDVHYNSPDDRVSPPLAQTVLGHDPEAYGVYNDYAPKD